MKLKGFRFVDVLPYADGKIETGECLTVLTGVSESGKSCAMRGLNQAFRNLPAGIDLLRHKAKRGACSEVISDIEGDDGTPHVMIRRRGKTKNEYVLDGQPLLAIGRDVPEEVTAITRLSANAFQLQSDGIFLLSKRDGEVAKALSSAVGLSEIDAALSAVRTRKTANDTELRDAQTEVTKEQAAAKGYEGLEDAEAWVDTAERIGTELLRCDTDIERMSSAAYELEAMPEDSWLAVQAARQAGAHADASERALVACGMAVGERQRMLAELDRLPETVDDAAASRLLLWAGKLTVDRDKTRNQFVVAETLLVRLDGIRSDIGILPRRATLMLTKAEASESACSEAFGRWNDMKTLLDQSEKLRPDMTRALVPPDEEIMEAKHCAEYLDEVIAAHNEMVELFNCLSKATWDSEVLAIDVQRAEAQIADYKREHPVCPECGAEQQHWHVG